MGGLKGRITHLEGRIEPVVEEDEGQAIRSALMRATLNELSRLKASRARHMRGGEYLEPEDIPGQYLTKTYTTGQLIELAIRRVWEREELPEDLMDAWTRGFKELCGRLGSDLEKVEDDGT